MDAIPESMVDTDEGTLVRIQRTDRSWLRSKTTKRHGTQCLLRRFDVDFLDDRSRTVASGTGYVTAGDDVHAAVRAMASRRIPFHALVRHDRTRMVHVVRTLDESEARAIATRARRLREDAEWDAAGRVHRPENEESTLRRSAGSSTFEDRRNPFESEHSDETREA